MRTAHRALLVAAAAALIAAACADDLLRPGFGSIVIRAATATGEAGAPAAGGSADAPAPAAPTDQDSAYVTVAGPTTKSVKLTKGATGFTGTVDQLTAGSYTVSIYWYTANQVTYFNRVTGVTVTAGQATPANVTAATSFVPTLTALTSPTTAFRVSATFSTVQNADSYKVEYANNPGFTGATSLFVRTPPAPLTFAATGTFSWRVRSVNAQAPSGGAASTVGSVTVSTDLRTRGSDLSTAANLGFFATTTATLDSLNIYPATNADWFSVSQCNGDTLTVSALALRLSPASPLNSALQVYNASGLLLAQNNDSGGTNTDAFIKLGHSYDNAYKIRVFGGAQNTVGHYKLQIQGKAGANNATASCRVTPLSTTVVSAGRQHACAIRTVATTNVIDCWGYNGRGQLGNGTTNTTSSPTRVSSSLSFSTVSAGGNHTCALAGAATLCWGFNAFGQVGDQTTTDRSAPTAVVTTTTFQSISAGRAHTCAINTTNQVYCWGLNFSGQLGVGTTVNSSAPVAVAFPAGVTAFSIAAGNDHTCTVGNNGTIYCWGDNFNGQLGQGTTTDSPSPLAVAPPVGTTWVEVRAGAQHTCARTSTNAAYCWGDNDNGQLGDFTFTDRGTKAPVAGGLTFNSLSLGGDHSCGLSGTTGYCWGRGFDGELGNGSTDDETAPALVSGALLFTSVSAGNAFTCGVTTAGTTYCWGWNGVGQLGDAGPFNHTGPIAVSGAQVYKDISVGNQHTCAVTTGNVASCWGDNSVAQLGLGTFISQATPQTVPPPLGVTFQAITAGAFHSCALATSGAAYCWGFNSDGQLGDGTTVLKASPTAVLGGQVFTQLSAGDFHTCGRTGTGAVYCWGANFGGELGNGTTVSSSSPVQVTAGTITFTSVSAGGAHTCGVSSGGPGYCWGDNTAGALGDGTQIDRLTPTVMSGGFNYASISAGFLYGCGRTTANAAYCWGANGSGQLGTGNNTNTSIPVLVTGGITWQQISTSRSNNACGAGQNGEGSCWGGNFLGQIGDGTFAERNSPTAVLGLSFTAVQSGDAHTCGLFSPGTAYCWGNNEAGQLGNGSRTIRTTPQQVITGPAAAPPILTSAFAAELDGTQLMGRPPRRELPMRVGAASLKEVPRAW